MRNDKDVEALNQHQFLNCWANIYVRGSAYQPKVYDAFCSVASIRPNERHIIHYAVLDHHEEDFKRYRVIDPESAEDHQEALIHVQKVYSQPSIWPKQLRWRSRGIVFTNGTGIGYIRRAWAKGQRFRKELARKPK